MVSISETTDNQSHQNQHNIQQQQQPSQQQQQQQHHHHQQQQLTQKQQEQQEQLIKSIQLYHNQHNKTMSTKPTLEENQTATLITSNENNNKSVAITNITAEINNKQLPTTKTTIKYEEEKITTINKTVQKPPKSAVSERSIEIEIDKTAITTNIKPRNLKLDLITSKSEDIKSPKTPKTPKSPLSAAGRLSHQTSLSSQIDVVEDRKTLRDALYQGIFHRHRKTIFAMGSFLRMLRSRNSQYNTIRSSSEDNFDL
ncbi:probable serine/threonine-protein kinase MARK-A isoform X2 [Condylostylus longicornis]|uniref:probable serine/threonine-protein kinase MARK-A isoform X2 n=1 Tax=Condylostylus longicornis TaxID=2530218 RepID=UPI00244E0196|nr:probable serine/threonine-protein kinase MARK-A isoform X2 [Condylostylus longicornis]